MEAISARVRPIRSARTPNKKPPIAEATKVNELRRPAVPVLMPNSWIKYARTNEYSMTSMASSIQPKLPATNDLRSAGELRVSQAKGDGRRSGLFKVTMNLGRTRHAERGDFLDALA